MHCVTTVVMRVLWNGEATNLFIPSIGLRQWDPLFPHLFILYMECLAYIINKKVLTRKWIPYLVSCKGPKISHLFFANDLVLFGESSLSQMEIILKCHDKFCLASWAKARKAKTKLFCSTNTKSQLAVELSRLSGFDKVDSLEKYLGVQLFHGWIAKDDYSYVVEKAKSWLDGGAKI